MIVPHVGEFDFAALYLKRLPYERAVFALLEDRVARYDAIIEIGANVGIFTVFFATILEDAHSATPVYAFEPAREAFARLHANILANHSTNVSAFNCAIGSTSEVREFYEPANHLTNGSLHRDFAELFSQQIERTLVVGLAGDAIARLVSSLSRILIKLDVEGAEPEVLCSLKELIVLKSPDIIMEVLERSVAELNCLEWLTRSYTLAKITNEGLVMRDRFEADNVFRDYFLERRESLD